MEIIYCNNLRCEFNKALDMPINFKYQKYSNPIGNEDNKCFGRCTNTSYGFKRSIIEDAKTKHKLAVCTMGKSTCDNECLFNHHNICDRKEIFVDKISIGNRDCYVCKCRSDKKISGHVDFSRFGKRKDMF